MKLSFSLLVFLFLVSCSDKNVDVVDSATSGQSTGESTGVSSATAGGVLDLSLLLGGWQNASCMDLGTGGDSLETDIDLSESNIVVTLTEHGDNTCTSPEQVVRYEGNVAFSQASQLFPYEAGAAADFGYLANITITQVTYQALEANAAGNVSSAANGGNHPGDYCFANATDNGLDAATDAIVEISDCYLGNIGFVPDTENGENNVLQVIFAIDPTYNQLHTSFLMPFYDPDNGGGHSIPTPNPHFTITPTAMMLFAYDSI